MTDMTPSTVDLLVPLPLDVVQDLRAKAAETGTEIADLIAQALPNILVR